MPPTAMQRRYRRFPRLMFHLRRLQRVNYEPEMELLTVLCDPGKTSVDIGAKIGMYTYRLLRHSADVVAFEPIPLLISMLERVFRHRRCRIMPFALSDAPGRATLRVPYGPNGEVVFGRSTVEPTNTLATGGITRIDEVEVEVRTLDDCELRNVGFIKVDVEGHEQAVLRGAVRTLARETPNLLVEANDHHHAGAVAELRRLLDDCGYEGFFLRDGGLAELGSVADPNYFRQSSIENFLFIHGSRQDVRRRLDERLRELA